MDSKKNNKLKLELDVFEGPLDLLLHLINQLEIDIYDIPITTITVQYMMYLENMQEKKINIASEYFVMAATLMHIKSEMLVPRNENKVDLEDDFYQKDDPRKPLMELLVEYKKIKDVVPEFEAKQDQRSNYFGKLPVDLSKYRKKIDLNNESLDIDLLSNAFISVLKRKDETEIIEATIETEKYTIENKTREIYEKLLQSKTFSMSFSELLNSETKEEIVAGFLALLELMKNNRINAKQKYNHEDIIISLNVEKN